MLKYRVASITDAALIQSLAQKVWPDTFSTILSEEQIDYMLDMMYSPKAIAEQLDQGHVFLLLQDEGQAIGYTSYQVDYLASITKIHKLYILPNQQGKGAGKFLVDNVCNIASKAGQSHIRLDVNYKNKAIGFYQHLGFKTIERVDTNIGNGYLMEDYVMEKAL